MALAGLPDSGHLKKSATDDDVITELLQQRKMREQKTDSDQVAVNDRDLKHTVEKPQSNEKDYAELTLKEIHLQFRMYSPDPLIVRTAVRY